MGFLFERITRSISKITDILKKEEEPEEILEQHISMLTEKLTEAESATMKMIAEEKSLTKRITATNEKISKREAQAIKALRTGNEDLARRVLEDKSRLLKEIEQLEQMHAYTDTQADELKDRLYKLKKSYHEIHFKREQLKNKVGAATARALMNQALSSTGVSEQDTDTEVKSHKTETSSSNTDTETSVSVLTHDDSVHTKKELQEFVDKELEVLKIKLNRRNE